MYAICGRLSISTAGVVPILKTCGMEHQTNSLSCINPPQSISPDISWSYEPKARVIGSFSPPTIRQFGALQKAFGYFNRKLFDGQLAGLILTLNERAHSKGYYKQSHWVDDFNCVVAEINISPSTLLRESKSMMSTLVHEMVHHAQYQFGSPGPAGYHNLQFARFMAACGLITSSTGNPGGARTGYRMTHYIQKGGLYDEVFSAMPEEFLLPFKPTSSYDPSHRGKKECATAFSTANRNKIKYQCMSCKRAFWGSTDLFFICGHCGITAIVSA